MTIDWEGIRRQFPVTDRVAYLNTAAAGPLSLQAAEAATNYYQQMLSGGDAHWDVWLAQRESVRQRIPPHIADRQHVLVLMDLELHYSLAPEMEPGTTSPATRSRTDWARWPIVLTSLMVW